MDKVIAGAKQEGTLVLNGPPGQGYRDWVAEFTKKYPFVKVEQSALTGAAFVARVLPEQQAGQYLWDIHMGGPDSGYRQLVPANAVDPLTPALLLPEILDDSKWYEGFNGGFADAQGKYIYAMQGEVEHEVIVNRDVVPQSQLNSVEALNDPKWKGKISILDPRANGAGAATGAHFVLVKGADWWRQMLQNTQPALTQDRRQQFEWVVRGQYPITIAPSGDTVQQFRKDGLANSTEWLAPDSAMGSRLLESFSVALVTRAPHPNAARLFLNWVLSREGQDGLQRLGNNASRRLDLGDVAGLDRIDPKAKYADSVNKEVNSHYQTDAINIAKEVLK